MATATYIRFTDDKEANRNALAEGVRGIACVYAGKPREQDWAIISEDDAPELGVISSVEVYQSGAVNAFVASYGQRIGFIRYRDMQPGAVDQEGG
jgi:hypothetical protein